MFYIFVFFCLFRTLKISYSTIMVMVIILMLIGINSNNKNFIRFKNGIYIESVSFHNLEPINF